MGIVEQRSPESTSQMGVLRTPLSSSAAVFLPQHSTEPSVRLAQKCVGAVVSLTATRLAPPPSTSNAATGCGSWLSSPSGSRASSPTGFEPQHFTCPALSTEHAELTPMASVSMFVSPGIATGR